MTSRPERTMCEGCPFREPGESRSALLRYIVAAPDETWPCHESDPDGLCLGDECAGRALFAKKIMAEVRNDGTNR